MNESKSYSISFKQIKAFCEILGRTDTRSLEFLSKRFSDYAPDFDDTVAFLELLQLLSHDESSVEVKPAFVNLLTTLASVQDKDPLIKEFVIDRLVNPKALSLPEARAFLNQFHWDSDAWRYVPSNAERLKYSSIRNLFIDLDVVEIDHTRGGYLLLDTRHLSSDAGTKERGFRRVDWSKLNQQREELGRAAELAVMELERSRLRNSRIPLSLIEHVADNDLAAGFDILSYEEELDSKGQVTPRYIEVKAVSALDFCFHWSKNEIEVSREMADRYMLYLLPVKSTDLFYTELLRTIRDPHKNLFGDVEWDWWEDSFSFSLAKGHSNSMKSLK